MDIDKAYTPEQIARALQLSRKTVYELIKSGEIIAKKYGKVYRVPKSSVSFLFNGLDDDLLMAEKEDLRNIAIVEKMLKEVRLEM